LILNELDVFLQNNTFDIYFYRNSVQNKFLYNFFKKHPNKITLEHNTKELEETISSYKTYVKAFKFKPSPSYFKLIKNSLVKPVIINWYYGKKTLFLAKQGVAVTNEICDYEKKIRPNYKCTVISNGINVNGIDFNQRSFNQGDTLKLIMLVGKLYNWHGLDLLLESFKNYTDSIIKITIIGNVEEGFKNKHSLNKNIVFINYLQKNELQKYISQSHIGLGSFALFRIKLNEASVLKVREYLAAGMPIFIGYKDTDVIASETFKKYTYSINFETTEINWSDLYSWAVNVYKNPNLNKDIRNEAFNQIDVSNKVKLMLEL
jgi:hypothetical protein